jgi:chaperonin cofactor prefoldin
MFPLPRTEHREVVFDPRTKLVDALDSAQEYLDLAIKSKDRGEREFFERIVELYVKIADELEALIVDR